MVTTMVRVNPWDWNSAQSTTDTGIFIRYLNIDVTPEGVISVDQSIGPIEGYETIETNLHSRVFVTIGMPLSLIVNVDGVNVTSKIQKAGIGPIVRGSGLIAVLNNYGSYVTNYYDGYYVAGCSDCLLRDYCYVALKQYAEIDYGENTLPVSNIVNFGYKLNELNLYPGEYLIYVGIPKTAIAVYDDSRESKRIALTSASNLISATLADFQDLENIDVVALKIRVNTDGTYQLIGHKILNQLTNSVINFPDSSSEITNYINIGEPIQNISGTTGGTSSTISPGFNILPLILITGIGYYTYKKLKNRRR